MKRPRHELSPSDLRWTCSPADSDLRVTEAEIRGVGIIGQDRAIRAMKMGMELYAPGFNVFVCGITGTGRTSTVKQILDHIKSSCPAPPDRCFVHNFHQPDRPRLLSLPRGRAREFRSDMQRFVKELVARVPALLDSEAHAQAREKIVRRFESEGDRLIEKFERRAEKEGFALKRVREGNVSRPELFAMVGGQPVAMVEMEKRVQEKKASATQIKGLGKRHAALQTELEAIARETRLLLQRMETEVAALEKEQVKRALDNLAAPIVEKQGDDGIRQHLADAIAYLSERIHLLRTPPASETKTDDGPEVQEKEAALALLDVNVVLDNTEREACPVVVESLPTRRRLFGYIERETDVRGRWLTDFRKVRCGSLLMADGGYLVLNAEDIFHNQGVWQHLKRTLVKRALEIPEDEATLQVPAAVLNPEPIPINVKVILIGDTRTYHLLFNHDTDFRKIFKVLADFDFEMKLSKRSLRQYAAFVGKMCREEGLAPFDAGALAAVAEQGARKAGSQKKLTARFGEISDLLRESDYWRRKDGSSRVQAKHVRTAVAEADRRGNMWEEKVRDMVVEGHIAVEVKGRRAGQVNGLTIHDSGAHVFGLPARITASAAPGDSGIINIEREARLSGSTHDKGVLIIGGWFREMFGRNKPITFTASIAFEQSYAGIDGDSATAAEICALTSALSGAPIDQGIAVTGSVDQKGQVQPVGGINQKVEGFYEVCKARGLTGGQGVIVPKGNVDDLMLREEVVQAVRKKRFHIYCAATVEEAIEILTGLPAGERGRGGEYPEGTVYAMVDARLREIGDMVRNNTAARGHA